MALVFDKRRAGVARGSPWQRPPRKRDAGRAEGATRTPARRYGAATRDGTAQPVTRTEGGVLSHPLAVTAEIGGSGREMTRSPADHFGPRSGEPCRPPGGASNGPDRGWQTSERRTAEQTSTQPVPPWQPLGRVRRRGSHPGSDPESQTRATTARGATTRIVRLALGTRNTAVLCDLTHLTRYRDHDRRQEAVRGHL